MKDKEGNIVSAGDVLIELGRGFSIEDGMCSYSLKIWEMPEQYNGNGYVYSTDGERMEFWWANVGKSIKITEENTPAEFIFSFFHGMNDLDSLLEHGTIEEIIFSSNWEDKIVLQSDVDKYVSDLRIANELKIKTKEDFINNFDIIKNLSVLPNNLISDIFNVHDIEMPKMYNGELGLRNLEIQITLAGLIARHQVIGNENK